MSPEHEHSDEVVELDVTRRSTDADEPDPGGADSDVVGGEALGEGRRGGASARAHARWSRRKDRRQELAEITSIEDAAERRIADMLSTFRSERPSVSNEMVDEILSHVFTVIDDDASARRRRVKLFVAAGTLAAVASGAVVVAVVVERNTHVFGHVFRHAVLKGVESRSATSG